MSTTQPTTQLTTPTPNDLVAIAESRVAKMQETTKVLIELADKELTADIDQKLESYIIKFKDARADMEAKRKPITAEFDRIRKMFTSKENDVDALIASLQTYRNRYATQQAEEQRKAAEASRAQMLKDQELIDLKAAIELDVIKAVQDMVDMFKTGILKACGAINKENFDEKFAKLQSLSVELDPKKYDSIPCKQVSKFGHDVATIHTDTLKRRKEDRLVHFRTEMQEFKNGAIANVKDIPNMPDEVKAETIANMEQTIAADSVAATEVAQASIDANAAREAADVAFNAVGHVADSMPEARSGYEIEIKSPAQWAQVIAIWTSKVLPTSDRDLAKVLDFMKKDLEALAHKEGFKVDGLTYKETFKAVNRRKA